MPAHRARWHRAGVYTFALVSHLTFAAILLQVFLAGAGLFSDHHYLTLHRNWVPWFQEWPLVLLVLAFALRMSWRTKLTVLLLRGLIGAQYGILETAPNLIAGLHTLNAIAIAFLSWHIIRIGNQMVRNLRLTPIETQGAAAGAQGEASSGKATTDALPR